MREIKSTQTRLSVELPQPLKVAVSNYCHKHNLSLREFILSAIEDKLKKVNHAI
jgi:hypothetical protein